MSKDIVAMNVYLPANLYKRFKIKCIEEGLSVKSVIIDFVKDYGEEENVREDKADRSENKIEKED